MASFLSPSPRTEGAAGNDDIVSSALLSPLSALSPLSLGMVLSDLPNGRCEMDRDWETIGRQEAIFQDKKRRERGEKK